MPEALKPAHPTIPLQISKSTTHGGAIPAERSRCVTLVEAHQPVAAVRAAAEQVQELGPVVGRTASVTVVHTKYIERLLPPMKLFEMPSCVCETGSDYLA